MKYLINSLKQLTFLVFAVLLSVSTARAESWLTWSEFDEDGVNVHVYLTQETEARDSVVKKISLDGVNITPALLVTQSEVWVVWVNRTDPSLYLLHYARIDTISMDVVASGHIATRDKKIYSPTIILSSLNNPVVAWSAFDGDDEEIRLTCFLNHRWRPQQSITDNHVPDTSPIFTNDSNGETVLSWERITSEGVKTATYVEPFYIAFSDKQGLKRSMRDSPNVEIKNGRHGLRKHRSINKNDLPPSFADRKDRFFMGSRVEITP